MERLADAVNPMNARLEHGMIKEECQRLKQIRDKTYELNSLLWAALHTDDEGTVRRDLEWATRISLEVTRELLEYAGGDKRAIAEWISATPRSPADQG